ncbi:uncharacterized protein CEXT_498561 [Caerostris extrusa]|uniref:Uncharacterized protein n=1 Tax=Caerostris extrusa TaxID=172846 RepID=A0AAV4TFT2_CAEEX|nr:uncharacterized protein CEXT_498561 [Caerostris extrusa]
MNIHKHNHLGYSQKGSQGNFFTVLHVLDLRSLIVNFSLFALGVGEPGCMARALWSSWHESIVAWLGVAEGLLVPLLLFCRDPALHAALRRAFQRRSGALSPLVSDEGPFQMYFDKDHFRKRGTFGSVTPVGIITNYRRTPGKRARKGGGGAKYTLPGLHGGDSVLSKACFVGGTAAEPLSKLSCADLTSLEMWREEEENFYATLSDDFSTFSCKSGDDSALSEDLRMSEELYGGSFTTVANDDFEFHDTRPCGGEVKMKPALVSPATPPSRKTSFRGSIFTRVDMPKVPQERRDLFDFKEGQNEDEDEHKDPDLFVEPLSSWQEDQDQPTELVSPIPKSPPNPFGTLSRHQKSTSYSMNDLDLIHQKRGRSEHEPDATFLLPVKSESTMSLYRLNVDQDLDPMALTPSRSENNVNGDSGFGSGAQSTNPVWSGFLCRKPSDPFWNMRKPTTAVATTPNRNYPAILHPRMRKIPWISAWKKLDENSVHNEKMKEQQQQNEEVVLGWKENLMYESNATAIKPTIDEELSDAITPNSDYNLNIFAKESGVLIENAYGKIVRDDCGVQVNFYGKNVQYDDKDSLGGPANAFERSTQVAGFNEPLKFNLNGNSIENHEQHLSACVADCSSAISKQLPLEKLFEEPPSYQYHANGSSEGSPTPTNKQLPLEKLFEEPPSQFKCEPRLNGGHYENLFGTKENIFAHCDLYFDKKQNEGVNNKFDKKPQRESSFRNANLDEHKSIYGHLNKPERQDGGGKKIGGKSPLKSREIRRRESDNRGNRCGMRRREGRTRSDPRSNFLIRDPNTAMNFAELTNDIAQMKSDKNIEIEMQNVNLRSNLNNTRFPKLDPSGLRCSGLPCREGGSEERRFDKNCNNLRVMEDETRPGRVERKDSRSRGRTGLEPRGSGRKGSVESGTREGSFKSKLPTPLQRRESSREHKPSGLPVRVDKMDKPPHHRNEDHLKAVALTRDNQNKKITENRNEGLWVNAIPFSDSNKEEVNSPKKDSRRERPMHRSPRKSNLPRRESSENKGNARIKRKVSGSRQRVSEKQDPEKDESAERKPWAKEVANRADAKKHTHLDDFFKFRDKCEDNFSHIQNLNRETSAERECHRVDQMLLGGKLNGNIAQNGEAYPFETFHEGGKMHNTRPSYPDNDNCREKRLAITDFL